MNFTLCCKPAGIIQQVYCVYVTFPVIFNLRLLSETKAGRYIVVIAHLDLHSLLSVIVFLLVCEFYCVFVRVADTGQDRSLC